MCCAQTAALQLCGCAVIVCGCGGAATAASAGAPAAAAVALAAVADSTQSVTHIMLLRSLPSFGPASSCLLGELRKSSSWPPVAMHRTAGRRCPGGLLSPQQAAQPSPARPAQPSPPSRHRAGRKYCNLRCGRTRRRQLTPTAAAVLGAGNLMVFAGTLPELRQKK